MRSSKGTDLAAELQRMAPRYEHEKTSELNTERSRVQLADLQRRTAERKLAAMTRERNTQRASSKMSDAQRRVRPPARDRFFGRNSYSQAQFLQPNAFWNSRIGTPKTAAHTNSYPELRDSQMTMGPLV